LALNAGNHPGNQPTRLAHLDDGNDRAIFGPGRRGTCSSRSAGASGHCISQLQRRWCHLLVACPIASSGPRCAFQQRVGPDRPRSAAMIRFA
jgi:hypothetical protein